MWLDLGLALHSWDTPTLLYKSVLVFCLSLAPLLISNNWEGWQGGTQGNENFPVVDWIEEIKSETILRTRTGPRQLPVNVKLVTTWRLLRPGALISCLFVEFWVVMMRSLLSSLSCSSWYICPSAFSPDLSLFCKTSVRLLSSLPVRRIRRCQLYISRSQTLGHGSQSVECFLPLLVEWQFNLLYPESLGNIISSQELLIVSRWYCIVRDVWRGNRPIFCLNIQIFEIGISKFLSTPDLLFCGDLYSSKEQVLASLYRGYWKPIHLSILPSPSQESPVDCWSRHDKCNFR